MRTSKNLYLLLYVDPTYDVFFYWLNASISISVCIFNQSLASWQSFSLFVSFLYTGYIVKRAIGITSQGRKQSQRGHPLLSYARPYRQYIPRHQSLPQSVHARVHNAQRTVVDRIARQKTVTYRMHETHNR